MITVTVSGTTREGKSTIATLIQQAISSHLLTTHYKDDTPSIEDNDLLVDRIEMLKQKDTEIFIETKQTKRSVV